MIVYLNLFPIFKKIRKLNCFIYFFIKYSINKYKNIIKYYEIKSKKINNF